MKNFISLHPWKIIEETFNPKLNKISESLFSIGNGRMGQRANFPERYSGQSLPGNYLAGIYYPDKTRVGWWKNGYPEYFAKVLNAPNWVSIDVLVNDNPVDLAKWQVSSFRRELDMEAGILSRQVLLSNNDGIKLAINSRQICHMLHKNLGMLEYQVTVIEGNPSVTFVSAIEGDVRNEDANYDEQFWEGYKTTFEGDQATLAVTTKKTGFVVQYAMHNTLNHKNRVVLPTIRNKSTKRIEEIWQVETQAGESISLAKHVTVLSSFYYPADQLHDQAIDQLQGLLSLGFDHLIKTHQSSWSTKWSESDVEIKGDVSAQQGIRFNIFQLNQTYTGDDDRLNIGPKGFTGEKYGGSTYWDTEAYCLPFYLATSPPQVARNLLLYRYKHLGKAIENAGKLGFHSGAALYPMVTMTGEECHNEWEITFEEIHRNGAIAYAIYDYIKYTGDAQYLMDGGLEVLIAIARFWTQRVHYSKPKKQYVIHGVTGPNEYENNINNNWYTNYIAKWCLQYTSKILNNEPKSNGQFKAIINKVNLGPDEIERWQDVANNIYLPKNDSLNIFLQQEGFLEKEIQPITAIPPGERPINQYWSWDRILRSCYIKQADVLQGLYFFEEDFSSEDLVTNFKFYEPLTVHESSLSPCVHAILACSIGDYVKAYEMYLRTARLDLDDYNNDSEDGCHITSMAGTWLAIIKGFAGMRVVNNKLSFRPHCPPKWDGYNFNLKFRGRNLQIEVTTQQITIFNHGPDLEVLINGNIRQIVEASVTSIDLP